MLTIDKNLNLEFTNANENGDTLIRILLLHNERVFLVFDDRRYNCNPWSVGDATIHAQNLKVGHTCKE